MKKQPFTLLLLASIVILSGTMASANIYFAGSQKITALATSKTQSQKTAIEKISTYSSFAIPPKPIAFVLYGLGGIPLAAHLLRRRKNIMTL